MKTLLLIDYRNTIIRGWAANKELTYQGESTGGLYSFINQLSSLYSKNKFDECLLCTDCKPYLRKEYYPNYKSDRKQYDDDQGAIDLKNNFISTKQLCELVQIPLWEVRQLEADDLIGLAIQYYHQDYESIIVLSNDSDLNQLLAYDNVQIYKNKKFYDRNLFEKDYDFHPKFWPLYTALVGSHNGVPGIKGIGKVNATKAIKDSTYLENLLKMHGENIELNYMLAEVPFFDIGRNINVTPIEPSPISVKEKELLKFLTLKGIEYTYHMRSLFNNE